MNHKKKSTGVWEQINFPKTRRIGPSVYRAWVSKGEIQTKYSCGWTKQWLRYMFFICWLPPVPQQKFKCCVYSWLQIIEEATNLFNSGRHQRDRAPFMLRDGLEYAAVAKYKTRNRKNRGVGALLAAQGAERFVSWQGDSVFGNLIKMLQTHLKL